MFDCNLRRQSRYFGERCPEQVQVRGKIRRPGFHLRNASDYGQVMKSVNGAYSSNGIARSNQLMMVVVHQALPLAVQLPDF